MIADSSQFNASMVTDREYGLYCDTRLGGTPRYVFTDRPERLMNIPPEIRKSVVFVGYRNADGIHCFAGTAFYVMRQLDGTDRGFIYLLTAKHVIDNIRDKGLVTVCLRVNLKSGGTIWVDTDIKSWLTHPDDQQVVDVAVMKTNIPQTFDHLAIPFSMLLTDETVASLQLTLNVGLEVFLAGLFSNHTGRKQNIPIVRVGNLVALLEEEVQTELGFMEAYLVEARSFGGISGSPVFIRFQGVGLLPQSSDKPNSVSIGLSDTYYLLGLMHGHWNMPDSNSADTLSMDVQGEKRVNLGIAIVVPIHKILEVLNQPAIRNPERAGEALWRKQTLPVPDLTKESDTVS